MNDADGLLAESAEASRVLSVAELNRRVSKLLERSIPLVWVAGEVSNLVRAASGHWYFSLKDRDAQVRCVMFRNANRLLDWPLRDGEAVEVRALAGLYAPRGEFQLTVESMRRAGAGALYEAFLRIQAKLAAEGLFAPERKRTPPSFPRAIGVVTSLQAAALRDVLTTLSRRAPHLRVIIYPSPVQGRDAPERLAAAIDLASTRALQHGEIDVLLVVRGGGSIEDLWAFNDEGVARAIARASIPVVSGVGHETDVTIADFVAHVRAATPTAAAELVSPDAWRLRRALDQHTEALRRTLLRRVEVAEQRLDEIERRLRSPAQRFAERQARLAELQLRLGARMRTALLQQRERVDGMARLLVAGRPDVAGAARHAQHTAMQLRQRFHVVLAARAAALAVAKARLDGLDPQAALRRGYAIVEQEDGGALVDDVAALSVMDRIRVRFARGEALAEVRAVRGPEPSGS